eukprot:GGOE01042819.1.p1 GENE.GGOE01042819.1~~GGOE01042819.1.p1  ORF type:complete len:960 (+),score=211.52 GGOE01042819.1:60-2882(+)
MDAALAMNSPVLYGQQIGIHPAAKPQRPSHRKGKGKPPARDPEELAEQVQTPTVWVGSISQDTTEDQIVSFFERQCGPVRAVRLCHQQHQFNNYAFLTFSDVETARMAVRLRDPVLGPNTLRILPSSASNTMKAAKTAEPEVTVPAVWVGLQEGVEEVDVRAAFQSCGTITELTLLHNDRGPYALIAFDSVDGARQAVAKSGEVIRGRSIVVRPRYAQKRIFSTTDEPACHPPPCTTEVYIGNVGVEVTEASLQTILAEAGHHPTVLVLRRRTDPSSGRPYGFAFARFKSVEEAQRPVRNACRGERTTEASKDAAEDRDALDRTVCVSGLAPTVSEGDIRALLEAEVGTVLSVEMAQQSAEGHPRHCFVELDSPATAQAALLLHGQVLHGSELGVSQRRERLEPRGRKRGRPPDAPPSETVWVGGLARGATREGVTAFFEERCGRVKSSLVMAGKDGAESAYAFVTFHHLSSAQAALHLTGSILDGRPILVNYRHRAADPPADVDAVPSHHACREFQKGSCKFGDACRFSHSSDSSPTALPMDRVCVRGLPPGTPEDAVHCFFKQWCGPVQSLELKHDTAADPPGDVAFVTFAQVANAENALRLEGATFGDRVLTITPAPTTGIDCEATAEGRKPPNTCSAFLRTGRCPRPSCPYRHISAVEAVTHPKLWVGNLPPGTTDNALRALLEQMLGPGSITSTFVHHRLHEGQADPTTAHGYGFVHFATLELAQLMVQLADVVFQGNALRFAATHADNADTSLEKSALWSVCPEYTASGVCATGRCPHWHPPDCMHAEDPTSESPLQLLPESSSPLSSPPMPPAPDGSAFPFSFPLPAIPPPPPKLARLLDALPAATAHPWPFADVDALLHLLVCSALPPPPPPCIPFWDYECVPDGDSVPPWVPPPLTMTGVSTMPPTGVDDPLPPPPPTCSFALQPPSGLPP